MPETLAVQPYDVHNQFLVSNVHPPDWANRRHEYQINPELALTGCLRATLSDATKGTHGEQERS
ncbi:MAG TPA: hypothetical protein VGX76_16890 [Pirellulales bacterium]|jgi:hypothetical protein|nr:hypothetical protein [Pirellulales bacterium]